jgi:hypothetical protein
MWRVIPVKGTSEDEVVIGREAAQTGLVLALVDQTTCLVDDDQGEDCPGGGRHVSCTFGIRDRMMAWTHMMGGVKGVRGPETWPGEEERRFTAPAACLADDGGEIKRIGRNSVQLQVRCAWRVLVLGLSQMLESRGVGLIGALVSGLEAGRAGSSRTDGNHPVMKSYLVSASIFLVFEITHRFVENTDLKLHY